jgi:hypothetical protein
MKTKIAIGLPSKGHIWSDTTACLVTLGQRLQADKTPAQVIHTTGRTEVGRNTIAERAVDGGFSHVLFIDSDMTFPQHTAKRLLKANKDIIGCNAAGRETGNPVITTDINGEILNYVTDDIKEVDFIGMAVTLIKTDVFRKMKKPWFFAPPREGTNVIISEDVAFCRIARKIFDYKIYCDMKLSWEIGHIGGRCNLMTDYIQAQIDAIRAGKPLPEPPDFVRLKEKT